ncbi:MAG TPA: hypothetical protein VGB32_09300 [Candidatus Bathyarchaeia archaeon]
MITVTNVPIFHDVLRNICQNSPIVYIEKTKNVFTISAISSNELCLISTDFKENFFENWDDRIIGPFEIEAKILYDISNMMQKKSTVKIDIENGTFTFEIRDFILKKIKLTEMKKVTQRLELIKPSVGINFKFKSENFIRTISELSNILDETQLSIKKGTNNLVFSGRKDCLSIEIFPQEIFDFPFENDIYIEFPIKSFQHFMPLLSNFKELNLIIAPKSPLIIEGDMENWRIIFAVSKKE